MAATVDRFESFAERYIVERAHTFTPGREKEEAWTALNDAEKIYGMVQERTAVRNGANPARDAASGTTQAPPVGQGGLAGGPAQSQVSVVIGNGGGGYGGPVPDPVQQIKDTILGLQSTGQAVPQSLIDKFYTVLQHMRGQNGTQTSQQPTTKRASKAP